SRHQDLSQMDITKYSAVKDEASGATLREHCCPKVPVDITDVLCDAEKGVLRSWCPLCLYITDVRDLGEQLWDACSSMTTSGTRFFVRFVKKTVMVGTKINIK
ncbi:hypothetical protein BgiMline_035660, partial [Biomphalaria glabrata]